LDNLFKLHLIGGVEFGLRPVIVANEELLHLLFLVIHIEDVFVH
jgi:hypothetical protein